jgi:hypothetical protein
MQRDSKGLIGRVVALLSLCLAVGEAVAVAHGVIRQHKRILHTAKRHGSPWRSIGPIKKLESHIYCEQ